ncbi:MAG: 4Fe-4S binding protein [Desulfobulbaceae bacterium]|nr:4Fe-4S binding protein [Desulfobulbaceae bacterium]
MLAGFLLNRIEQQAKPAVGFNPKQCLRSRLNTNACEKCLNVCRSGAISLNGRNIVFSEDRCRGCMACVSECPNDAFDCGFNFSELLQALQYKGSSDPVVMSCDATHLPENLISIPCIGVLSGPVLAALHCAAKEEFYLDVRRCVDCSKGHVLDLLHDRIQGIISRRGTTSDLKIRYKTEENYQHFSFRQKRRGFLRMSLKSMKRLGKEASLTLVQGENRDTDRNGEGKEPPAINRLLQQALDVMPENAVQDKELLLSYHYRVTADENCDLCPLCTGMCPTGALKRGTAGNRKKLVFTSAGCSGCGLCVNFCRKKALTLHPGIQTAPHDPLTIV